MEMPVVPLGIARIIMGKRPNQRDKVKCVLKLIKIDVSTYVIWLPTTQEPKKHLSSYDCSCAPGFLETGTGPLDSGCEGQGLAYFVNDILYVTYINSFILSRSNLKLPNKDINECDEFEANGNSPCDPLASCENLPGNYTCTCPDGYQGDFLFCFFA